MPEANPTHGRDLLKSTDPVTRNPRWGTGSNTPERLALGRGRGHRERQAGPAPASTTTPGDARAADRQRKARGHSPCKGPAAAGGQKRDGVRPAQAACEEAQGEREARGCPGSEEPASWSQQGCHGSAVPTAGCTLGEKDRGST